MDISLSLYIYIYIIQNYNIILPISVQKSYLNQLIKMNNMNQWQFRR